MVPWAIDACPFLGPLSCAAHGENDDGACTGCHPPGGSGTATARPGQKEGQLHKPWNCGDQDPLSFFSVCNEPRKTSEFGKSHFLALKIHCPLGITTNMEHPGQTKLNHV